MKIHIKETRYSTIEVDASDYESAEEAVADAYVRGDFVLNNLNSSRFFEVCDGVSSSYDEVFYGGAGIRECVGNLM